VTEEELTSKYRELVRDPFEAVVVRRCNHKPHPYMIGTEHVVHASERHGGMLGIETMDAVGCAWQDRPGAQKCRGKTSDHTSDLVLFVKAIRDCTNREAAQALFALKPQMLEDKLDGIAFVKSEFTIAPPVEEVKQ
jgi:hypothetical protein